MVFSAGWVPTDYYANYAISDDRDATLWLFVEIESEMSTTQGQNLPAKFGTLNTHFNVLFPKFPQDYAFAVTYNQCLSLSSQLAALSYQDPTFKPLLGQYKSNCYKPFTDILKKVNSSYTVVPKAKASPMSWPSPLTVTFDARGSIDPSDETIPSSNFFWYYRDVDGTDKTIGNGPVVNYVFAEPWNYLVHLTVRSSNNLPPQWIFDGEKTMSIDVTPKTAIISIYTNGQRMTKDSKIKIWTQEAERWVVFDASATIPMWWRQLMSHHREITSKDGFTYTKDGDGAPSIVRLALPGQGEFKIALTTTDNETNKVTETYSLVVSDPIAIIKQSPDKWNTSSTFTFDANASYSVLSQLRLYTWEIFDQEANKIEVYQWKSIKQNFKEPGSYTVKLTVEDQQAQTNFDTVQIVVDSTDPIAQFEMKPTNEWLYPSRFTLDASISSDVDVTNGFDQLTYERVFPEELKANIIESQNTNETVIAEFNGVGKYKVKLVVKDQYGKMAEIEKDLEIKSTLRPEIDIMPVATYRWNPVNLTVRSNEPIINYQWDFGDGTKNSLQVANITHVYRKTGVYTVKLSVDGANGNRNEVSRLVFIWEKDYPVAGFVVYDKQGVAFTQNTTCTDIDSDASEEAAAYQIDRYQDIKVDPSLSVNSKWAATDLAFYFQPGWKEIYKQTDFSYKFDEMWCQFIDLTAEDTAVWKNSKVRVWFKVVNALPRLDNVVLLFPQYGNEMGVGFNENQVKDIFNDTFDPLIVKVSATMPVDPDGNISYFKRYYYYKDDPNRVLETKITPSNVPYAFFSLPRIAGEFMFGVMMYDNDDGKQSSEEIVGNGPIVFFPPDASKPDVPLVTLKSNQASAEVGDEITFDVVSKIISDRPDFVKERTIYYDFDGDGTRDLITKQDRVTYAYDKPSDEALWWYTPRASVLYRWYRGVSNGWKIIIKNWLKPKLLYDQFGKLVIFKDISVWDIEQKSLCLDIKTCTASNAITWWTAFSYEYPDYGKYFISLDVSDKFANKASKKLAITLNSGDVITSNLSGQAGDFHLLAIPAPSPNQSGDIEFFVGKSLENSVLYYISYPNARGECYVDVNIAADSNSDSVVDNDHDFNCNQLSLQKYQARYDGVVWRIYYSQADLKLVSKDFKVNFLDFEVELDAKAKAVYDDITALLNTMEGELRWSGEHKTFKTLLTSLRDGLGDANNSKANLVQVTDYMEKNTLTLTDDQKQRIDSISAVLSDKSVVAAQWGSEYQKAKAEILSILPLTLSAEVADLFTQFDAVVGDQSLDISQQDKRKEILQNIVNTISANVATKWTAMEWQIDKIDMDTIIMPNICVIMQFYSIPSTLCNSDNTKAVPEGIAVESGQKSSSLLKIILIVLGILVWVFLILVVIFAVRARMGQEKEEEIGGEVPQPPTPTTTPTPTAT